MLLDQAQRGLAVDRAARELETDLALEEAADRVEDGRMVIGHDAADRRARRGRVAAFAAHAAASRSAPVAPTSSGSGSGAGRAKK